jgi:hypothetical protein
MAGIADGQPGAHRSVMVRSIRLGHFHDGFGS